MSTLRDQLLALATQQTHREPVKIPGIGEVHIRVMTGAEAMAYSLEADTMEGQPGMLSALLMVCTVCDHDGQPVFTKEDIPTLVNLPYPVYQALVKTAQHLNALDITLEDVEKNSVPHTRNGSGIASPEHSV